MDHNKPTTGSGGQQGKGESLRPDTRMLLAQVVEKLEDRVELGPSLAAVQRRFPEWELREIVGRGGMASVYKAWDPKLERYLAIKVLDESLAEQPDFAERFAREARTLVGLQHPNVLRPLDYGEREGLYFIVTEYFAGGNLAQHLKEGQLPADRALSLIREIGGALAYAHEQGLVHRDLKPSNILIDEAGHACLADFGIVHLLGERQETLALTRTQQSLGTPHYVAPEMLHGDAEVDARGDIYALGVTAYEMLTGRLPLGRFEPPSKLTAVGPAVDDAIDRCLRPDPTDRWRSVGGFLEALDDRVRAQAQEPIFPRAWKWGLLCLVGLAVVEIVGVGLRVKTGRWVLPTSLGIDLAIVCMFVGWIWLGLERVWPERPSEGWQRAVRNLVTRGLRWSLLASTVGVLMLILGPVLKELHPSVDRILPFLTVRGHRDVEEVFGALLIPVIVVVLALFAIELLGPWAQTRWRAREAARNNHTGQ